MLHRDNRPDVDQYERQLHASDRAGESGGPDHETTRTAYDVKDLHRQLHNLDDNLLKQIPVLETGTRLKEGGVYLDLAHPERGEFRGMSDMIAGAESCLVAKNMVEDYELWNLLRGERDPERLGRFTSEEEKRRAA
jgi:hypothetical protein